MGDKGSVLVIQKDVNKHRGFEEQLFQRTDGDWNIKLVLSSYTFTNDGAMGIPDGKSDCSACVGDQCGSCSKSMPYSKAFNADSYSYTLRSMVNGNKASSLETSTITFIIQAMRNW